VVYSLNGSGSHSAFALGVVKVPPRTRQRLTWQSAGVLNINTHWIGRRLWCAEEDCPGCGVAPTRTVSYVVVTWDNLGELRPQLLETTPHELQRLEALGQMEGLELEPGLVLDASRNKSRSPTRLEPVACGGKVLDKLKPPRICVAAASVLAGVPLPAADDDLQAYVDRIKPALRVRLEQAIAQAF